MPPAAATAGTVAPLRFSMFELAAILATIPAGAIDGAAVKRAFASATTSPRALGPDLHCGQHPWPGEQSHCRSDLMVYKVVNQGGQVVRQPLPGVPGLLGRRAWKVVLLPDSTGSVLVCRRGNGT